MATDALPAKAPSESDWVDRPGHPASVGEVAKAVFQPLTSLKLTIALLSLGILLVLFGTLAQDKLDMWEVITHYFRSWITWVELRMLLPDAWFPHRPALVDQPLFGKAAYLGFPFPGGLTIGLLTAANLLAAHTLRFKVQSRGTRLWAGIGLLLLGGLFTWLVIASGHNQEGIQGEPAIGWQNLWWCVKLGLLAAWLGSIAWLVSVQRRPVKRPIDWAVPGATCAAVGILAISLLLLGQRAYLGNSGMRILWQLIQGGLAGVVLLGGCLLLFRKRGGIALIHAGIGLMMLNELLVGNYAVEERMRIQEGQSVNYVKDIRAVELAVVDPSDPQHDRVVVVPLSANGRQSRFLKQRRIRHPKLPFDLEIVKYYKNSSGFRDLQPGEKTPATAGIGATVTVDQKRPASGAGSAGEVNVAAAFVKFTRKGSSEDLGTYLLSQLMAMADHAEKVSVDGKTYDVYLRFKRTYKPYTVHLIDVRKVDYIGTMTPKDYSSVVRLVAPSRNVDIQKRIWMNNPLRYAGETFYQSGYENREGVETTDLQVVKNTGWMIPYVGCMIVATGMLAHFSMVLMRFLNRLGTLRAAPEEVRRERAPPVAAAHPPTKGWNANRPAPRPPAVAPPNRTPSPIVGWLIPLAVVLLFAWWLGNKAVSRPAPDGQAALEQFGRLPVAYQGRVKPYDSLARNSLRVISGRETFRDKHEQRQPAIRWLLDVISGSEDAEKCPVFRIESLEVLQLLGLEPRSGFRYAYREFESRLDDFRRQVQIARNTARNAKEKLENYQRKLIELDDRIQLFFALREAHRLPPPKMDALEKVNYLKQMVQRREQILTSGVPYGVPTRSAALPWEPLSIAATRVWVKSEAKASRQATPAGLAALLVDEMLDRYVQESIDAEMLAMMKAHDRGSRPGLSAEQRDREARRRLREMPPAIRAIRDRLAAKKRAEIEPSRPDFVFRVQQAIETANGPSDLADPPRPSARLLVDILTAYRAGNMQQFNRKVAQYRQLLDDDPPHAMNLAKTNFEASYNAFAAFVNCMFLYVVVFLLSVLGWLTWIVGWNRPLHRAAFGLVLLTFLVHTMALIARIYISGRPPVTNLYSSAIFIGWACVALGILLEAIFRLGFGNVVSAISGFATMFVAWHLTGDGDTFTVLQAVLDTQFWLATHVVCITLGYAATFLAGTLGILYVFCGLPTRMLGWKLGDWTVGRILTTMTYGVICFAIFFSFVGTVLGGLWADDSWGRFWGWDPKENGALIIVLWNAIVLHARWDGLVKDRGLALLAIGGNIVTSWSWFGVNQLGIGLHSYGFTEGVLLTLAIYVMSQFAIIGIGLLPKKIWRSFRPQAELADAEPA